MLMLSRVCADFYDTHRKLLFRITRNELGLFVDAPESIKQDPLFQMLVNDGSIKFPEDAKTNKALENDPMAGATAEGREIGAASGGNDADFEVNRNKRAVRGTVAPIEVADKTMDAEATKPAKAGKSAKAEEKPEIKNDKAEPEKTSK